MLEVGNEYKNLDIGYALVQQYCRCEDWYLGQNITMRILMNNYHRMTKWVKTVRTHRTAW